MEHQTSKRTRTIFRKLIATDINSVRPGDVVYIKMWNPKHYGIRELEFYGRIIKITKCYFWIAEYCDGHAFGGGDCGCTTDHRTKVDSIPEFTDRCTRKWHKNSLIEIRNSHSFIIE